MAAVNPVFGKIGYRHTELITIANGTALKTSTFTPEDSDLHDISQEGILITHLRLTQTASAGASHEITFGIFNKTSGITPATTPETAAWATRYMSYYLTGVGIMVFPELAYDLSGYPGGGVGLIGDFITLAVATAANVGAAMPFLVQFNYDWVKIDSESYRRLLYARSI